MQAGLPVFVLYIFPVGVMAILCARALAVILYTRVKKQAQHL